MDQLQLTTAVFREFGIVQERVDAILKQHLPIELPTTQFKLLNHLIYTTNQNETVSELAKNSHVSLSAMSQVIKQLKMKGYVTLEEHSQDTRRKTVLITDSGQQAHLNALNNIDVNLEGFSTKFNKQDLQHLFQLSHQFRCAFEDHYQV